MMTDIVLATALSRRFKSGLQKEGSLADQEEQLKELENAILDGDRERILELAKRLQPRVSDLDDQLLVATGFLEAGAPVKALEILQPLVAISANTEQTELLKVRIAEALYATGNPQAALESLKTVTSRGVQEASDREYFTGLCCDHLGDRVLANAHFSMATELDPDRSPAIPMISTEEAQSIVEEVIQELPDSLRQPLEEVPILIEDLPHLDLIQETEGEIHPDTLGLYTGVSLQDRSHLDADDFTNMQTTAAIRIYRRNLERISQDQEELRAEIRITLLHEFGHHLGLDEDEVDRLGLS